VAIEVFDGNTADPMTLASQVEKLKQRFQLDHVVLVPLIRNERTNAMAAQLLQLAKPLISGTTNRPTKAAAMPSPNPWTHIGYDAGSLGSTSPNTAAQNAAPEAQVDDSWHFKRGNAIGRIPRRHQAPRIPLRQIVGEWDPWIGEEAAGNDRLGYRLSLRRLRHAANPASGSLCLRFESDSKNRTGERSAENSP
jgi:hypothetical protein